MKTKLFCISLLFVICFSIKAQNTYNGKSGGNYQKTGITDTIKVSLLITICDTCYCQAINGYGVRYRYVYIGDPMPPGDYSDKWNTEVYLDSKKKQFSKEIIIWNGFIKQ